MTLKYMNHDRTMSIKGVITQQDGNRISLTESDVVMYSSYSGGFEGIPLGSVIASSYTLELDNVNRKYTPQQFDNAQVAMQIGILVDGAFEYSDFGTWYVDSSSAPEQSVSITLFGYDALNSKFEAEYIDDEDAYPTTIGSLVVAVCAAAGVMLNNTDFANAAVAIEKVPEWREGVTLRDVLSYCTTCAGGFAQIAPNGKLEIWSFADGRTISIGPDKYISLTLDGGSAFSFNALEVMMTEDADDYTRYAINGSIPDNATNTIQLDYNPLFTESIVNSVVTELSGLTASAGTLSWIGDPSVRCGDFFEITMLNETVVRIMATSLSFTFHGGLVCDVSCELPSKSTVNGSTYSATISQYDSDGNVRVTRIPGLDKKIISATAGHFESLTAKDITTDRLITALLNAVNIRADEIDVGSVDTDELTALVAKIVRATIDKIDSGTINTDNLYAALAEIIELRFGSITGGTIDTDKLYADIANIITLRVNEINAGNIETDELYAAIAHIISLSVESIKAGRIEADVLAAVLAEFVTLHAGTGEFDFATIQNLVAQAMALQQGSMDTVYIRNLAVTSANMLSATLGKLVIKGDDGKYYRVFVGSDGTISTEEVPDGDLDEEIDGGRQIVETTMNVGSLNATNLQASSAVINSILTTALSAEKITAADALIASATIPALYATTIQAIGNSLELIVGRTSEVWRGEEPPEGAQPGDLWVQPATGFIFQMVGEVSADFYLDGEGVLYSDGGSYFLDENGDLYSLPEDAFALGDDGTVMSWQRVKDSELSAAELKLTPEGIMGVVTGAQQWKEMENAADEMDAKLVQYQSEFTQRMDGFELSVERMVDGDELRTYLRYQDGRVEIGRSDSRYTTETSDAGFVVLQDGVEMTSMEKNTVAAPVIEAKRQFQTGNFIIRAGADGGLLIL